MHLRSKSPSQSLSAVKESTPEGLPSTCSPPDLGQSTLKSLTACVKSPPSPSIQSILKVSQAIIMSPPPPARFVISPFRSPRCSPRPLTQGRGSPPPQPSLQILPPTSAARITARTLRTPQRRLFCGSKYPEQTPMEWEVSHSYKTGGNCRTLRVLHG